MDVLAYLRPPNDVLAASLLLALLLDYIYPEHRGILLKLHPVHTCFVLAKRLGRPYSSRARGVATWFICVLSHLAPYATLIALARYFNPLIEVLVCAYVTKVSISIVLLLEIAKNARDYIAKGDLDSAKRYVQMIVRRDVGKLSEGHVISAAIESLAESFVDGFLSPMIYYVIFGPLGALIQRLANTLDGALGFKTPEYRDVGWFSAKVDTILNFVPARLAALTIIFVGAILGLDYKRGLRTWLKFRRATESVNAGHPMSAMAGVLGVKLEKLGHYSLGEGSLPKVEHLDAAMKVISTSSSLWIAICLATLLIPLIRKFL